MMMVEGMRGTWSWPSTLCSPLASANLAGSPVSCMRFSRKKMSLHVCLLPGPFSANRDIPTRETGGTRGKQSSLPSFRDANQFAVDCSPVAAHAFSQLVNAVQLLAIARLSSIQQHELARERCHPHLRMMCGYSNCQRELFSLAQPQRMAGQSIFIGERQPGAINAGRPQLST